MNPTAVSTRLMRSVLLLWEDHNGPVGIVKYTPVSGVGPQVGAAPGPGCRRTRGPAGQRLLPGPWQAPPSGGVCGSASPGRPERAPHPHTLTPSRFSAVSRPQASSGARQPLQRWAPTHWPPHPSRGRRTSRARHCSTLASARRGRWQGVLLGRADARPRLIFVYSEFLGSGGFAILRRLPPGCCVLGFLSVAPLVRSAARAHALCAL